MNFQVFVPIFLPSGYLFHFHLRLSYQNRIQQTEQLPSHRPDTKDYDERSLIMQLEITDLTRTFKDAAAVDHISCTLGNGVYGLLGVNGAGKTLSLIHI